MAKKFQKRIEDFICEHCGTEVHGDGYTNHCPHCLWSKHVDVHPGDREATCLGMMEPIRIEGSTPNYILIHRCIACGFQKSNAVSVKDEPDAVIALAQKASRVL